MFNPVRSYKKYVQRLDNKRKVFNSDKKTLDLQELNRFVNGTPERRRTAPTYLRAKTRDFLYNTLVVDLDAGKYKGELKPVANHLANWCMSPRAADNPKVRHWLKQLAEAKPVGRPAVESVEGESVKVEPVKIPTWTVAQIIKDLGGDEGTHVSSEDVSKRENVPKDVSKKIDPRGRRPLPLLRPKSDSTQPRNGFVHMVDGEVVPMKL